MLSSAAPRLQRHGSEGERGQGGPGERGNGGERHGDTALRRGEGERWTMTFLQNAPWISFSIYN